MEGDELRQTLVTIGISIVAADLMLAIWTGKTYQFTVPTGSTAPSTLPIVTALRSNGAAVDDDLSALPPHRARARRSSSASACGWC